MTPASPIVLRGSATQLPSVQRRTGRRLVVLAQADQGAGSGARRRQPWDFGRFLSTVLFFNEPPSPGQILKPVLSLPATVLRAVAMQGQQQQQESAVTVLRPGPAGQPVVLVAGATGGVGKRVVGVLLAEGRRVRVLVRDVEKAKELLGSLEVAAGGSLELAAADITQLPTLVPELFEGVRAVICCTAVRVQPKEGDTVDRKKYMQGIKFYDPEIVGDTPETVELKGIRNLMSRVADRLGFRQGNIILSPDGQGAASVWGPLDDVVMGGVSQSRLETRGGGGEAGRAAAVFTGIVSADNSGGFTSVRSKNFEPPLDVGPYDGIELRVKGDGQRYKMILRTDANWDGVGYCQSFDTRAGEWQSVRLPFAGFFPVFRAKTVKGGQPLDPSKISSIQLMLSKFEYDGELNPSWREGPFELPIAHIKAYLPDPAPARFVLVSSAGVTRPNRPGINVEQEPPAVRMNDMLGGILTFKLAGEDVVRGAGVPFAIVRPCALTEEPAGAELVLEQGDVIKGKISRDDVAALCVQLLRQPAAADTTFEVKSTVPFSTPFQVDPANPPPPRDWAALLGGAGLKQRVTGKTINGVYTGKEPEPET